METVSWDLAHAFVNMGHELVLVTRTPAGDGECATPFAVVRRPSPVRLLQLTRWCDLFFHNNVSLQTAWPLLLVRRPWVVAHHIWIARPDGRTGWKDKLKRRLLKKARGAAISTAIARSVPGNATVVGNPYKNNLFKILPDVPRSRDIVFVGRLVSDKGVDVLLEAVARLRTTHGLRPTVTLVGAGPEERALRSLASRLELGQAVTFAGPASGTALVELLNRHRIIAIPSRWNEPFGLVALEGVACGCVAVGSEGGGLPDAIGPCGLTFPNGDSGALAAKLQWLLADPTRLHPFREAAPEHLEHFKPETVARRYVEVFEEALRPPGDARA